MDQHRQRIVDIDELAGGLRNPLGNFTGEFFRSPRAQQSFQQCASARIAVLVDAVAEAGKTLAKRDTLPDDGADITTHQGFD